MRRLIGLLLLALCVGCDIQKQIPQPQAEEITPLEDLMREHGVLRRVLLIYEDCIKRIEAAEPLPAKALGDAVTVIQTFIESYHENLEENYIFPIFETKGQQLELINVLRLQHERGRGITAQIQKLLARQNLDEVTQEIAALLQAFIHMYRPHAAREDTVLFPQLHELLSEKALDELGEKFEAIEHERFGEKGFEGIVQTVAAIEQELGIYELAQFTP